MKTVWIALKNWHQTFSVREQLRRHDRFWRWLVVAFIVLLALVICSQTLTPDYTQVKFELGARATTSISAPFSFSYADPVETRAERDEARNQTKRIFRKDSTVETKVGVNIDRAIDIFAEAHDKHDPTSDTAATAYVAKEIRRELSIRLTPESLRAALPHLPSQQFRRHLKSVANDLLSTHGLISAKDYSVLVRHAGRIQLKPEEPEQPFEPSGVLVSGGDSEKQLLERRFSLHYPPVGQDGRATALYEIGLPLLLELLEPNVAYDREATLEAQESAAKQIAPRFKEAPNPMVRKGEVIDEVRAAILEAYNKVVLLSRFKVLAGHLMVIVGIVLFFIGYLRKFQPQLRPTSANIAIAAFPVLLMLLIGRVALEISPEYGGYLFLAGAIGIVGVITIGPHMAMMQVLAGSLLFGLIKDLEFALVIAPIFSGFAAIAALYRVQKRRDILAAGFWISLANLAVVLMMHYVGDPVDPPNSLVLMWAVLNGLLCSIFSYPLLVTLEALFDVVTDLRLLELTGSTHPALLDLEEQAPGSYQHSLNVTKLAEAAAADISANLLLVRAGGYFHDIGKMVKPKYFSENQVTPEERVIHRDLTPYMSALIIKNHVREGINLAREKYRLPERVIDFIPQHQGTTAINFFHQQALREYEESSAAEPVNEDEFRYPGPTPQTIEAAVVMLADAVEATATAQLTGANVRDDDIRRLVRDTIDAKFAERQFDECNLTLRDLHRIGESFVKSLRARYHFRVQYPEKKAPAGKGKNGN